MTRAAGERGLQQGPNDDTDSRGVSRRPRKHAPRSRDSDGAGPPASAAAHLSLSSGVAPDAPCSVLALDAADKRAELIGEAARACASVVAAMCPGAVSRCLSCPHDVAGPSRPLGPGFARTSSPAAAVCSLAEAALEQDGEPAGSQAAKRTACDGEERAVMGGRRGGGGGGEGGGGGGEVRFGCHAGAQGSRNGVDMHGRIEQLVQLSQVRGLAACCVIALARMPDLDLPECKCGKIVQDVQGGGRGGAAGGGRLPSRAGLPVESEDAAFASKRADGSNGLRDSAPRGAPVDRREGRGGKDETVLRRLPSFSSSLLPPSACCAPSWRDAILSKLKGLEEGGACSQFGRGSGKCRRLPDASDVHFVALPAGCMR